MYTCPNNVVPCKLRSHYNFVLIQAWRITTCLLAMEMMIWYHSSGGVSLWLSHTYHSVGLLHVSNTAIKSIISFYMLHVFLVHNIHHETKYMCTWSTSIVTATLSWLPVYKDHLSVTSDYCTCFSWTESIIVKTSP